MFNSNLQGGLPHPVGDARFYAGVPLRRLIAFVIDTVAIVLLGVVATLVFGVLTLGAGFFLSLPVMAVTAFVYRAGTLARLSATPGMWLTGIELRRRDGTSFALVEALIHTAVFTACLVTGILQLISVAMMVLGPMGRGLPDLAIGAAAINRPA